MASDKVDMSLDEIIKKGRRGGGSQKRGPMKGGVGRKGKFVKKIAGNKQQRNVGQGPSNNAATKRLVTKLVKKALAQNIGAQKPGRQLIRKTINKPFRGVSRRSQIIKKGPRLSETVVIKKLVRRPKPRQQVVREVVVQQQPRRFDNRPRIVYVEQRSPRRSFGGGFNQRRRFGSGFGAPRTQFYSD